MNNFLCCLLLILVIFMVIIAYSEYYRIRICPFKHNEEIIKNYMPIEDIFHNIDYIIATEIAAYEKYLTTNTDTDITSLTNTEFINIYQELSKKILKDISDNMWIFMEIYMTRIAFQRLITQRVYNYLADKVHS